MTDDPENQFTTEWKSPGSWEVVVCGRRLKLVLLCVAINKGLISLASHTLCREEGSGHAATIELLLRNAVVKHSG